MNNDVHIAQPDWAEKIKRASQTQERLEAHIGFHERNEHIPIESKSTDKIIWTQDGFSLENEMKLRIGSFIEIGGPTHKGFELVNLDFLDKKVFVSNFKQYELKERIDFYADAQQLPFKDDSTGILFAAYLPDWIRKHTIHEAKRVLEENGLFVWEGVIEDDIYESESIGFELVEYTNSHYESSGTWNVIFQKKKILDYEH